MTQLKEKDKEMLEFIKDFMLEHNVTPTIRDICNGTGLNSSAAAHFHFRKLVDSGYIIPFDNNTGKNTRYSVKGLRIQEAIDER